ncbi:translocase of chloroplast 120 [Carex littledalei]|uniref:Translocase of chloroplast 120 n=1 Tax=Carex littledalei TaxID=544730 RepID=A0A833VEY5_9POAL|nr:translocase of chloroplast 120 [Carex littledalei]
MDSAKDETEFLTNDEKNESFEPMDVSTDIEDGLDGDNFEDAIEAPVEEKEKNCENNEKVIEAITQQVFNENTKEKNEGDSHHFHSFDDTDSESRLWNGDEGVIIREIEEDRSDNAISDIIPNEVEVVNSLEKDEPISAVYNDGLNHEPEQQTSNREEEAGTSEKINDRETDSILGIAEGMGNGEVKSNEEVPPEKIIQEAQYASPGLATENEVEAYDGERGIVANEEVGLNRRNDMLTDPIVESDDAQNGDTRSYNQISEEEIVTEARDIDPLSVTFNGVQNEELYEEVSQKEIVQEPKDINPITVTSDKMQNEELQSFEEAPQKEVVEEPRDLGQIMLTSDGTQNGDLQESHDTKPMSNGAASGDVQSSEDLTQGAGDVLLESDAVIEPDLVSFAERYQTYEVEPANDDASGANESFMSFANGSRENPVTEILVQNNGAMNSAVNNIIEGENRKVEADHGIESIVRGHFDESPLVEDASDSSFSDNDENHTDTLPQVAAPAPTTAPAPPKPAGLGSASLPDPSSTRSVQHVPNGRVAVPQRQSQPSDEAITDEVGEHDEIREKLQNIRVKFLRLVHRLGQTPHNTVVAQVLYRLGLAEQLRRNTTRPVVVSFDRASVLAEQLELSGNDPLDFSCTIMLLGKAGVGKSSTINSLFNESLVPVHTFGPGTCSVQEISGVIQGINVKIIDTPGLSTSSSDTQKNEKILHSVKKFVKNNPPDIVLYFDRLDVQSRDYGDVGLLRTITNVFGSSIWFNAIIVLTHAASAPPEGPNGIPLTYDMFVTQRTHIVQQNIRQAAGDVRLMNPVSLVENHSACRMNRAGKRVLPNGTVWEPQLLLLSFASKILGEANALLKLEDSAPYNRTFSRRTPPLPYFLSTLLQSRPPVKLPEEEQFGDEDELLDELDDGSDSDDGSDFDDLPPFRRLTKSQLAKLSKLQRKAYFDEIEYREKLYFKKQLKEEKKRRKMAKKMAEAQQESKFDTGEKLEGDEVGVPASVPVPMPDMTLPASFDSDAPVHRYRYLDSSNQWLVRPVLDLHGWDHDIGYEGLNLERLFIIKDKLPVSVSGQLTKDKKESSLQLDVSSSLKHGEGKSSSLGLDLQSVGKDMSYTVRGETRFRNFKRNDTLAGVSVNLLGDSVSAGAKIEDRLIVNKQLKMLVSGGVMTGRGEMASGGRVEVTLKDKDYPIGRMLSTLALSIVDWHGELALGLNCQSQVPVGRGTNLVLHGNVSNKGSGQVGIRLNSSEQFQIALVALVPLFGHIKRVLLGSGFE